MHKITIPESFEIIDAKGDKSRDVMTFVGYVQSAIFNDVRWAQTYENLRRLNELKKVFTDDVEPGDEVSIEDQDIRVLKQCVEEPRIAGGGGLMPLIGGQMAAAGFMDAIMEAKKVKRGEEEKKSAAPVVVPSEQQEETIAPAN